MNCPRCGGERLDCKDSRSGTENTVRRRRVCAACGLRVTTHESIDTDVSAVSGRAAVHLAFQKLRATMAAVEAELRS